MTEAGVLAGLRVVELATVLAGPSIGQFCAELGAHVQKIEPPGGDVTRQWISMGERAGDSRASSYFSSVNWGKVTRQADLTNSTVRDNIAALVKQSDVVLTSFRPESTLDHWADSLRDDAPRLIHIAISAFPAGDGRPGFDAVIQAESGFMDLNREPGGQPAKMPVALMDVLLAHQLKEALLAALLKRESTGAGCWIDADLFSSAMSSLTNQAALHLWSKQSPAPIGTEHPSIVPYGVVVTTRDRKDLVLAVGNDRQFAELATCLNRQDWIDNDNLSHNPQRVIQREKLRTQLQDEFCKVDLADISTKMKKAAVPFGRIRTVEEALADPSIQPWILHDDQGRRGLRTFTPDAGLTSTSILPPPA